jgi:hypothetical protein
LTVGRVSDLPTWLATAAQSWQTGTEASITDPETKMHPITCAPPHPPNACPLLHRPQEMRRYRVLYMRDLEQKRSRNVLVMRHLMMFSQRHALSDIFWVCTHFCINSSICFQQTLQTSWANFPSFSPLHLPLKPFPLFQL